MNPVLEPPVDEFPEDSPLTTRVDHPGFAAGTKFPVLPKADRAMAFTYLHSVCGGSTHSTLEIVETVLVDPNFYDQLWCKHCHKFVPLLELSWACNHQSLTPYTLPVLTENDRKSFDYLADAGTYRKTYEPWNAFRRQQL